MTRWPWSMLNIFAPIALIGVSFYLTERWMIEAAAAIGGIWFGYFNRAFWNE